MSKSAGRFDVRVTERLELGIRQEAKHRGHASPSAFVRAAIEHEITGGRAADKLTGAEERIAATMEQLRREM